MAVLLTREQVRQVDRWAIEDLGIPGVVLMENAGRSASEHLRRWCVQRQAKRVVIFCGSGNNGGDGFVIARHLDNTGVAVQIFLTVPPEQLTGDAAINHHIAAKMKLPIQVIDTAEAMIAVVGRLQPTDLVVDALLGTGFHGQVRAPLDQLITRLNAAEKAAMMAVDVPSGLDCDTGQVGNVAIKANWTVTFVAAKVGFEVEAARPYTGQVVVCDIGAPPKLVDRALAAH